MPIIIPIFFIIYKIIIDPAMICDDNDFLAIYELKARLINEIADYNVATAKVNKYIELEEQLKEISRPNYRDFGREEFYNSKINSWMSIKAKSLHNANALKKAIERIESNL